jgi:FAD/FMN-containing dehydrogenase
MRYADELTGAVHLPGDAGYQHARKLFIGRRPEVLPAAVVECATEADIVAALAFARRHGMPFALRGGGHSFAEHSTSAGLVIDLARLDHIDHRPGRVVVGAGVQVGALTDQLAEEDVVVPVGWCRSVGVVGAVLGGGYGVLGRYYGLGSDHLLSARVLLADGRTVTASAAEHPDLFWALRGAGGGNFGVVLSMELRTRPAVPLVSVQCSWPYERAADVIDAWQHLTPAAPRTVNLELSVRASDYPDKPPTITLFGVVVGTGDADAALRGFPAPAETLRTSVPPRVAARHSDYPGDNAEHALLRLPEGEHPALRIDRAEFFTRPMPRPIVDELTAHLARDRRYACLRELELIPWGGALSDPSGGAFAHRDARFLIKHTVQTGCNSKEELRIAAADWVDHSWATTTAAGSGRTYPNYPDPALEDWPRAYYGANLPRLRKIKATYDPTGLFAFDQSLGTGEPRRWTSGQTPAEAPLT